jgi:hypothetical protein
MVAAALLNLITEGAHSPGEDLVKAAVSAGLMLISVAAMVVHLRHARAMRDGTAAPHRRALMAREHKSAPARP